jgi:putative nucleotidyltransferase with HDIG domain
MNTYLVSSFKGTVCAVMSLADAREISGSGHSKRVSEYALGAARELKLPEEDLLNIEYASIFHDIGKLALPDRLLNKVEDLTDEEWVRIRRHPVTGYILLRDVPFLREAARLVLYHHERYDGLGYPEGLKGDAIPLGARIIAVADAYAYMTTGHAYQEALTQGQAVAEMSIYENSQFCPVAVKALKAILKVLPSSDSSRSSSDFPHTWYH